MNPWLEALRPKTLSASVVPILVASALARCDQLQPLSRFWFLCVLTLLCSVCLQLGTNLVNDAVDYTRGADTLDRTGPKRLVQLGIIPPKTAHRAGCGFFALAALLGIPLLQAGGWWILGIGVSSILAGYAYTAGPYPLAYLGLGELFVFLFFGEVSVGGVYALLTQQWHAGVVVLGAQVGSLASVLIAINNYRDADQDRRVGKMTWAARWGSRFARWELGMLIYAPYVLGIFWVVKERPYAFGVPLLNLPLSLYLSRRLLRETPGPQFNRYLALSALNQLLFGLEISLGFWLHPPGVAA